MSSPVCLGQPPLPPRKYSKASILPNFLRSDSKNQSSKQLLRRYSLRKKHPDRFSCTYQSFSKDLYEGGAVSIRSINGGKNATNSKSKAGRGSGSGSATDTDSNSASRFAGKFPYSDFCESTTSLSASIRSRHNSLSSILPLSRSHSDGNLSSVSDDAAIYVNNNSNQPDDGDVGVDTDADSDHYRHSSHAFHNMSAPCATGEQQTSLSKYFRALSGSWKNLLNLGGMNRPQKCAPQIKKVAPPSVPDNSTYRHSGSSFSSAGYSSSGEDSCFSDPISKDGLDGSECYGMPGRSPNSQFNYPAFTFPGNGVPAGQYTQIHAAKNAVYYHHQLSLQEDQGIDMTQSPGRDSPGSSGSGSGSRHSTASVDSGRASGCHLTTPHCRSSMSTSSVGSVDHNIPAKVERLLQSGVPDQDVLHSWLLDLHFEEYFPLFVTSGYDLPTIVRMTPEDLTAIGIKKPNHRKRLKAEIAQLKISDGLPEYIPGSLNEWLQLLRLEEYKPALASQGYETIEDVLQLTWEDLEDIGIVKLGHQKRLLLAIKRVKDLKAGKIFPKQCLNLIQTQVSIESHSPCSTVSSNVSYDLDCPRVHTTYHSFHQPWELETTQQLYYPTADIVPIKVRNPRGKSLESLKDGANNVGSGTSSFVPGVPQQLPVFGWKYRSYDDGDITPTNENSTFHEGGGTLPRPRGLVRPRPVAKIPATLCQAYRNEEQITNEVKKKPPSPPKRHSESITVVADLHCTHIPPDPAPSTPPWSAEERQLIASLKAQGGSDSSFKSSSSSTESDSIPFANENAGTIKQRIVRSNSEYNQSHIVSAKSALPTTESDISLKKLSKEPTDVLDDIGNMLANLTDELDAMLEEEKRQGLNDD